MKNLTIKRSKWIHTKKDLETQSKLHRKSDGKMCCLGFLTKACGIPVKKFSGFGTVEDVGLKRLPKTLQWLVNNSYPSSDAFKAMKINDSNMLRKNKEKRIKTIFKRHGINVKFVD